MSNWNALPMDALWYGEVVFVTEDGVRDYNYAYSTDTWEPDPRKIPYPEGASLASAVVTPANTGPGDCDPTWEICP